MEVRGRESACGAVRGAGGRMFAIARAGLAAMDHIHDAAGSIGTSLSTFILCIRRQ